MKFLIMNNRIKEIFMKNKNKIKILMIKIKILMKNNNKLRI